MICVPVQRDNPRALASRPSTAQVDKPCYISLVPRYPVNLSHYRVSHAKDLGIWRLWYNETDVPEKKRINLVLRLMMLWSASLHFTISHVAKPRLILTTNSGLTVGTEYTVMEQPDQCLHYMSLVKEDLTQVVISYEI